MNLGNLWMAAGRRFAVSALLFLIALGTSQAALAQNAVNTVVITPPTGMDDSGAGNNTATDDDPIVLAAPQLTLAKASNSATFLVGTNGVYTLTLSNTSSGPTAAPTAGTITVEDTLPAGLSFVSASGPGWICTPAGQVVTCSTTAVIASLNSAPPITLTVAVAAAAAPNVTNTARASGGGDPTCPASGATQARCNPSVVTPVNTAPAIDFCAADSLYNITQHVTPTGTPFGSFYQYNIGGTSDVHVPALDFTVTGNLNGLMVDKDRNRLLFISYSAGEVHLWAYDPDNGGWYEAATARTGPDMPRAGMTKEGVGYLIAGGSLTPEVWRIDPPANLTDFGYTITSIGQLSYDIRPTDLGSGDVAFDDAGNGWMTAGQDLYKISFTGAPRAVRQQRPLLNGAPSSIQWAGVAFDEDGDLYVATNVSPSRYFRLDMGTGTLSQVATTDANQARDLASCAFPAAPQPAQLRVAKTLGLVNGAPYVAGAAVKPNDLLTYHIEIDNFDGDLAATLFPGDIVDSPLPANTTYVAAGNDFTCAGSSCSNSNTVNIAAGTSETLDFVTRVDDPLPANLASISNAVAVKGVDCAVAGNTCVATTPIAPVVTVTKTSNPTNGDTVNPGQTIDYTVTVTVDNSSTTGDVTLNDVLTGAQAFTGTPVTPTNGSGTCVPTGSTMACTLAANAAPGTYVFQYSTIVGAAATGAIGNVVTPGGTDNPTCAANACQTEHPVIATAVTVTKSSNPPSGSVVNPGTEIEYTVTVNVDNSATTAVVTLADNLTGAQTFTGTVTEPTGGHCAPSSATSMACTLDPNSLPGDYVFRYRTVIGAAATGALGNVVTPSGTDNPTCVPGACATTHTITGSAVTVNKTSNPGSGAVVNPGDEIEYIVAVTVHNSVTTGVVTLNDILTGAQTFTGAVTEPNGGQCAPASASSMVCTLDPSALPGIYEFRYRTVVGAAATGALGNVVTPSGPDNPTCGTCTTTHTVVPSTVSVTKSSNPANGSVVDPGDEIEYTVTVTVANSATTGVVTLDDVLTGAQTFTGTVTAPNGGQCAPASATSMVCTLDPSALPGIYEFRYRTVIGAAATGALGNVVTPSGPDNPTCVAGSCATTHTVVSTGVTVAKSSNPASGTTVSPGDTIQYTLTVNVVNSATTGDVTLTDTLSAGQTPGAMPAGCSVLAQVVTCVLPGGSLPNTYTFVYPATVNADATGSIGNVVLPSGTDNPTCAAGGCETEHTIIAPLVTVSKSSDAASGTTVNPGDTIQYTLTVNVANSATTGDVTLTDTLSAGQTLGAMPAGCSVVAQVVTCVLPAGALPNTYTYVYPATVNADATGSISNVVLPSGTDNPTCAAGACQTEHSIIATRVTVAKSSNPTSGATVNAGDAISYTVTVTVANSATLTPVVLADTLSGAHSLTGTPSVPAGGACTAAANGLQCTLAAGALPGNYAFVYQTVVAATASGAVGNNVAATGGGPTDPECTSCSTNHPIAAPVVDASKSSAPGNGSTVNIGDTIQYTLTVTVANAAVTQPVVLTDTPGAGLTIGALPAGCASNGGNIVCTLPTGTVPGSYTFAYPATVNANANGNVANAVVASGGSVGGQPGCLTCATAHPVVDAAQLRIVKQASPRDVKIGDLVRYTLTIENVGAANVTDFTLIDTPPAGFSYVAGSLAVADADGAGSLAGTYPIRVERLDVLVGQQAKVQYLLRVGAGVRPGTHVNRARAEDGGNIVSNEATAEVQLVADPLLDESLLIGTVFDDRDSDEWQDRAALEEVRVQGGFAPGAYVAGSTTLDRGNGPVPQADASAPLLHGLDIGAIAGRQSDADPIDAHTVVIGQTLNALSFSDDFVLTSKQGVTVRMDAAGTTRTERSGAAAKGLTAADPTVERRVSQIDGGYRVEYVIGNAGVDEHGIPGVRIASVEGLLIETDQFGRYHLEGVAGGPWERGRNFILKADPATLPPGSVFTDENPLVRRLTPGIPVRFDFPVKLPSGLVEGGKQQVEMELAQVMFDAGSAQLRSEFAPVIDKIVEQALQHGGGQVVISANGESQALAFDRAQAVRAALLDKLTPEQAKELDVVLRAEVGDADSTLLSLGESAVLGTFLFDTDKATVKPEYSALIAKLAAHIQSQNGGAIAVVGHADRRGSDSYNAALGLRRAKAVFDAIAASLSPEARAKLRVDINENPAAPAGKRGR